MKVKKSKSSSRLKFALVSALITFVVFSLILTLPNEIKQTLKGKAQTATTPKLTVIAKNLEVPWAIDFLPDGNIIFTERPGRVNILNRATGQVTKIADIPGVYLEQETGLLGIAVSPQFATNNYIFIYYTYKNGGTTQNKVVRHKLANNQLTDAKTIIDGIPGNAYHNGGRIRFGPDKFLYVATGDGNNLTTPQNTNSLGGKILRVTEDGSPAPGNPFNNQVYTYGHRNPQGFAWDGTTMYETEHGPSTPSCCDEINKLTIGKNYGWPDVKGPETKAGTEKPLLQTGNDTNNTFAPAGTAFYNGSIFYAALRGKGLYEAKVNGATATITKQHFKNQLGRIREAIIGPDNKLYITTSNKDGRGTPAGEDDKIIQLDFGIAPTNATQPQEPTVVPTFSCLGGCPTISESEPTHESEPTNESEPSEEPNLTNAPTPPSTNPTPQTPQEQGLLHVILQLIIVIILSLFGR